MMPYWLSRSVTTSSNHDDGPSRGLRALRGAVGGVLREQALGLVERARGDIFGPVADPGDEVGPPG